MAIVKKIKSFFTDDRGEMFHLVDPNTPITSALLITCKKGAIRANHYHKKDSHYSYLLEGKMNYYFKSLNDKKIQKKIIHKGEMVYTPPMEVHAMEFTEDSVFIAMATEKRSRNKYENDTVRVKII